MTTSLHTTATATATATATSTRAERRFSAGGACSAKGAWPKHRILFLLAGTFTLTGTALAAGVNRWFALLPAAVGANQLLLVATGWCPASSVLDRILSRSSS